MTTSGIHTSRQLLLGELIRRVAHKTPKQPAFVYENTVITYEEMERRVLHLAGWMLKEALKLVKR